MELQNTHLKYECFEQHDGMQKIQNTILKNAGNTVHYRVLVVYPHDQVADRELQVTAIAQLHMRIILHSTGPGKNQNLSFEIHFY